MDSTTIIKEYYNSTVETEWQRIADRPEFLITCRFLDRYIKKGDKILDIGGGPGRYTMHLAEKGCDVTLFDLSDKNISFAKAKAEEMNLHIHTVCGDACTADEVVKEQFDHILLMGPMYHLLKKEQRIKAINAALKLLKPNGIIYISFINMIAGMIYAMKFNPITITDKSEREFYHTVTKNKSFAGEAFTQAYFSKQTEILPFMKQFPLKKLHFFGQEGMLSPCENNIMSQPPEVVNAWIDFCEKTCERKDLLSWSEHLMYIGRKTN